jgi:hypothetical protein
MLINSIAKQDPLAYDSLPLDYLTLYANNSRSRSSDFNCQLPKFRHSAETLLKNNKVFCSVDEDQDESQSGMLSHSRS